MQTNESGSSKKKPTSAAGRTRPVSKAAASRVRAKKTTPPASAARPGDEQIRLRAYELFLQRNGHPADPMEDWLRAERELIEEATGAGSM